MRQRGFLVLLLLAAALPVAAAPDGADLYSRHCAACHGLDGSGGVGVPLNLPQFLDSVTDHYLAKTIRHGRPGRVMPGFRHLSDAQVRAIVDHVRGWSEGGEIELPRGGVAGDPDHGRRLYAQHCAACHGPEGEGGKGTGVTFSRPRDLPIIAPALRNRGFLQAASDPMIKATLMNGREGTPMVSFLEQGLSESDIDDIVAYVRGFEGMLEREGRAAEEAPAEARPVKVYDSPYPFDETVASVKRAAVGRNFRIIRTQYFDQGLVGEGREDRRKVIVYFCNFRMLNEALAIDPRVGLFLPCRVTVIERNDAVQVLSINPKTMSRLFNNEELDRICGEMSDLYDAILEEATL